MKYKLWQVLHVVYSVVFSSPSVFECYFPEQLLNSRPCQTVRPMKEVFLAQENLWRLPKEYSFPRETIIQINLKTNP